MKRFLLVLVPAVLLLTSCLGDDESTPIPDEVKFYDTFIIIHNHGKEIIKMGDDFIAMHEESGELISGITVEHNDNGTARLIANMETLTKYEEKYASYKGKLVVELSGVTQTTLSEATSKVINVSELQFIDPSYGVFDYGGEITINDELDIIAMKSQNIEYNNFSLGTNSNSKKMWTIDYTYQYGYDESTKIYTWGNGLASGEHSQFGTFMVSIISNIVKKEGVSFVSSGSYRFRVQNIGNEAYFSAAYGVTGNGLITITTTSGEAYDYQQSVMY